MATLALRACRPRSRLKSTPRTFFFYNTMFRRQGAGGYAVKESERKSPAVSSQLRHK